MQYQSYSAKSWVVTGTTDDHQEELQQLGGLYNDKLRVGIDRGWIFDKTKVSEQQLQDLVAKPVEQPKTRFYIDETGEKVPAEVLETLLEIETGGKIIIVPDNDEFESQVNYKKYTDKSWAVYGDTKAFKDHIKLAGGKFSKLSIGPAWVFSSKTHSDKDMFKILTDIGCNSKYKGEPANLRRNLVKIKIEGEDPFMIPIEALE